ncbi:AraC family transcriptional regulator [Alcaligenes pakistanensis]|uniref:AraC family transcriptional regulator n=1 Tax=Alcaligenes pakistanensis TaxID=1482717 RepID=A0A8H9IIA7_9BURK|nr:helix-turn-helix transcriptional regulator [Alcaligenes pakistanensis]GHC40434.1 AraC family transcriptional regulator [Alcaligenes pakistanensis]
MIRFTVSDFDRLGSPAGFRYRLPYYEGPDRGREQLCIAEGRVQHYEVRPGIKLVLSDIVAHHHYESSSITAPQFSTIVMLQGRAQAQLASQDKLSLVAQSGVSIAHSDAVTMTGVHPAGQRLRSINISLGSAESVDDPRLVDMLAKLMGPSGLRMQQWTVPPHLLNTLEQLIDSPWQGAMHHLLLEGVSLQVLAHALDGMTYKPAKDSPAMARDRQLLERVRERLYNAPGEDHSLADLAKLACMSPSTLRVKFQATYQCSVFAWLRERRLELARDYLAQGWSVQQAAHFVGYRHATNFATAFRERYGISPSELN